MMKFKDTEEQRCLNYFAQHAALTLRLQMGDNIDFEMTVQPIGEDAERFKTVRILCDKKVNR